FAVGLAVVSACVLTWMNFVLMADVNPANSMYFSVPLIAIAGAAVARLRAAGMAVALFVTAIAQALVPLIALVFLTPHRAPGGPFAVFGPNTVLVALFAMSALLFRRAARAGHMS